MGCDNSTESGRAQRGGNMPMKTIAAVNKINYYYFDGYGRGEPGRIMLWKAKAPVEDCRVGFDVWPKIKDDKPFKGSGMPVVEMPDGKVMSQSKAIWRYFAVKSGMYPKDPMQAFEHDYIIDHYYDIFNEISAPGLQAVNGKPVAELTKEIDDAVAMLDGFLQRIDPYVTKSTKFLFGNDPMFVDCVLVTIHTDFITNPLREGS